MTTQSLPFNRISSIPDTLFVVNSDGSINDRPLRTYLQNLTLAFNCPSFMVHRNNVNQAAIVSGATTKIQFNSIATNGATIGFDSHAAFDLVTNFRYTVPVPGLYVFGVQIRFVAVVAGTSVASGMLKNGSASFSNSRSISPGAVSPTAGNTILQPMVKGDTMEFTCFQDSGGNQDLNGNVALTVAWGHRISG